MPLQLPPAGIVQANFEPAQPFPLTISEVTGSQGRTMIFKGRSLPYRPVAWSGSLRVETKYFPGNPIAQAQVMGPTWPDTTMNGMWKDVFLYEEENWVQLIGFPEIGGPGRPGSRNLGGKSFQSGGAIPGRSGEARRARTVRDAMWMVQRGGQLLRVEWGSIVRFGFIENFEADHDREEDIRFTINFRWIGDTDAVFKPKARPKFDPPGLLAKILSRIQDIINAINEALGLLYGQTKKYTQLITRIGTLISDFIDTLASVVNVLLIPAQIFGTITQQLTSIILAVGDLRDSIRAVGAGYTALASGGTVIDANAAQGVQLAIAYNAARLGVDAANVRDQLEEFAAPEILGVYNATTDTTLRDVATAFYGSPESWGVIADFNGLKTSSAPRGSLILVPNLDDNQGG